MSSYSHQTNHNSLHLQSPSAFLLLQEKTCSKTKFSILLWISSNSTFLGDFSTPLFWIILLTLVSLKNTNRTNFSLAPYLILSTAPIIFPSKLNFIRTNYKLLPLPNLPLFGRYQQSLCPHQLIENYLNKDNDDLTTAKSNEQFSVLTLPDFSIVLYARDWQTTAHYMFCNKV